MNDHDFDELALLREIRGQNADPTAAEETRGLAALERGIAAQRERHAAAAPGRARARVRRRQQRSPRHRRGVLWGALGVVAVGAMVGVALVAAPAPVLGPVAPQDPAAHAVELLERSARAMPELVVGEGQFLRWENQLQQVLTMPWLADGGEATFQSLDRRVNYIPADPREAWTSRTESWIPSDVIFPRMEPAARQRALEQIAQHSTRPPTSEQSIAGQLPLSAAGGPEAEALIAELEAAQLRRQHAPTDATELRAFLLAEAEQKGMGPFTDEYIQRTEEDAVLGELFDTVQDQTAPSALRAACMDLLAEFPGLSAEPYVPPRASAVSDALRIESGTVVTVNEVMDQSFQLIFDEESATLLGTQVVLLAPSEFYGGIAPGTVVMLQTFESEVVDAVPDTEEW